MNAKQRCKLRRKNQRMKEQKLIEADRKLERKIVTTLAGCSTKTLKAISLSAITQNKTVESLNNRCLPNTWLYSVR
ncbi:transcriptional regulator [Photorhabdus heterorhabditis]|uniref:transcriptional antitermination N peptide n=1 Tax=Photorhabdus heterorhabditis TaxID=880156 RepID=UPI001BD3B9CE|nr:transcriptional regulator [Photorhabdus heterorhabditis]MBS9442460.1 transcriptional regulator [Photorhabdus heterorhabditis]